MLVKLIGQIIMQNLLLHYQLTISSSTTASGWASSICIGSDDFEAASVFMDPPACSMNSLQSHRKK
jgi:hypothetical protein